MNSRHMSDQHERELALSRGVFALLAYYGSGSTQTFFSIVDKALAFTGLRAEATQVASIRRLLYNRLLLFGFLESSEAQGQRHWSAGPNRLVRLQTGLVIPIGDTRFLAAVGERLGDIRSHLHIFYRFPRDTGLSQDLCCLAYEIDARELDPVAHDLECESVQVNARRLVDTLPPIDHVYCSVASAGLDPTQIDTTTELKRLDAESGGWVDADVRSLVEGLYRIPHVFGKHREIVIKKGLRSHVGFEIQDREWSLLMTAHLLRQNLGWRYNAGDKALMVPAWQIPYLPILIKRVLLAGTMQWPNLENGRYFFCLVPATVARRLASRYPMLGLSYA